MTAGRAEYIARMADRVHRGVAGYGCRVLDGGEDISEQVRAAADRLGRPADARTIERDFPFHLVGETRSATPTPDALEALIGGRVSGYLLRWDVPVAGTVVDADGNDRIERNAYARGSFDQWLASTAPSVVVVQANHTGAILGRWETLTADAAGLYGTAMVFATPDGYRALADIRSGDLWGLSPRATFIDADVTVEHDADGPYRLIHRSTLREAGPVDDPADAGALIDAVDGDPLGTRSGDLERATLGELLEELEAVTGVTREDMRWDARIARSRKEADTDEQVRRVERCVSLLKAARRNADYLYGTYRCGLASWDEFKQADAEADRHDAWLRRHTFADTYRQLVAGMPAKPTLTQRMLGDALRRRTRS